MNIISALRHIAAAAAVAALIVGCGGNDDEVAVSQVSYTSLSATAPLEVPAELRLPAGSKLPAVVVVHGSSGIDSRGKFHIEALNKAGIATLEIDMWKARGITGAAGRPAGVPETLPDAYGALAYLARQGRIDPSRIGIMGFSWGGVVSMLTATKPYTDQYMGGTRQFKAHAPFYPVCWVYNRVPGYAFASFTGAPVFIQGGELDTYDLPDTCPKLVAATQAAAPGIASVTMYPGATHAFDRNEPEITVNDPFSHLGAGGLVTFTYNPVAAAKARDAVVAFFVAKL
ncbi:MAG: dienelactone hydrolase family protein [Rubrivivax sp.]|nr:dienelactone hydrolase family protein [Rubrivivax sp.]